MQLWELILLAVGLSMDAFAVAVCKGLSMQRLSPSASVTVGLWFGGFQAAMPFIGYFLGRLFERLITRFDHWIAFVLLLLIGANMIKEAFDPAEETDCCVTPRAMLPMAIATSIDALAVGITFALLLDIPSMLFAVGSIGVITFSLSALGVAIGHLFGSKYRKPASILGGCILILLGTKILLEHLNILHF